MNAQIAQDGPVLSIAVQRDVLLGEWYVTRVDLEVGVIKNQTKFRTPVLLQQALAMPFLKIFMPLLPTRPQSHVYVDDAAQFELPSLMLQGIRVVAQRVFDGVQTVVIRFRQVTGSIQSLFAPEFRLEKLATRSEPAPAPVLEMRRSPDFSVAPRKFRDI